MNKKHLHLVLAGFFIGILWFATMRFVLVQKNNVHYHANFAVFVNGKREEFEAFTNYEEVSACDSDQIDNPKTRVHMHDNVSYVVHVHDNAATWGALFANLSFTLGNDVLATQDGVYVTNVDGKKLTFLLNGKPVDTASNRVIKSEDVLLVSYGNEDQTALAVQNDAITKNAAEYNTRNDPSSCTGAKPLTLSDRFKKAFTFTQ